MPRRRIGRVVLAVLTATLAIACAGRGVYLRRQARIHEFYQAWCEKKGAAHHAAARDCADFGGPAMLAAAGEYRLMGDEDERLAADHARLARAYWRSFWRPWLAAPYDPGLEAPP